MQYDRGDSVQGGHDRIFFTSEGHKERFVETMKRLGKVYNRTYDAEYAAAIYILSSDPATWNKVSRYVSHEGIDIETMLQEVDFSGGYGVLVTLAGNLFNNGQHLDPLEFLRLDEGNFRVALNAIILRRS